MQRPVSEHHPVWALVKYAVTMLTLTAILWVYATEFDETEMRTLVTFGVSIGAIKGFERLVKPQGK